MSFHLTFNLNCGIGISYRMDIHSSTKIPSLTNTNCWIILSGHNGETEKIAIPKGKLEFTFLVNKYSIFLIIFHN